MIYTADCCFQFTFAGISNRSLKDACILQDANIKGSFHACFEDAGKRTCEREWECVVYYTAWVWCAGVAVNVVSHMKENKKQTAT